jgi:hypothetical protein
MEDVGDVFTWIVGELSDSDRISSALYGIFTQERNPPENSALTFIGKDFVANRQFGMLFRFSKL